MSAPTYRNQIFGERRITKISAFGWTFHCVQAAAGVWYDMLVARRSSIRACGVYSFYTKGLLHGTNLLTGQRLPDRVPGLLSCTLPDIDAGLYRYATQEDSEWWCIDRDFNGGQLPPVHPLPLSAGQQHTGMVLVCTGPDARRSFESYTAPVDCLALRFEAVGPDL